MRKTPFRLHNRKYRDFFFFSIGCTKVAGNHFQSSVEAPPSWSMISCRELSKSPRSRTFSALESYGRALSYFLMPEKDVTANVSVRQYSWQACTCTCCPHERHSLDRRKILALRNDCSEVFRAFPCLVKTFCKTNVIFNFA